MLLFKNNKPFTKMKIRLFTFAALALLSSLSHADDLTQNKSGKQNIDEQIQIEKTRQIVDSVGFIDMDAQSRSFLSTDFKGIPIEDYEDTNDFDAHVDAS
ncbi:hypothetical protein HX793_21830 [Pseudomonas reactans]|uniref:hypothetical protein n=1 Tax=Pseudomonas TaxID=286 RepID=UPI0015A01148|nr:MULTISPECIES: hypothetical protein [Pseudomonas]NWC39653.1 hypothetical protein [Pseudomonas tolaasii]NWC90597.1 hypothetical protein [Pseudomonas reactans]NWD32426.1 hypothetical protein [Pseudomonas reactans]NWF17436.1 hypothetical protein [Pseudomonas reactans]